MKIRLVFPNPHAANIGSVDVRDETGTVLPKVSRITMRSLATEWPTLMLVRYATDLDGRIAFDFVRQNFTKYLEQYKITKLEIEAEPFDEKAR